MVLCLGLLVFWLRRRMLIFLRLICCAFFVLFCLMFGLMVLGRRVCCCVVRLFLFGRVGLILLVIVCVTLLPP